MDIELTPDQDFLAALNAAEASLARGEGREITQESMRNLADEVKQRGRARLAAEEAARTWMAHQRGVPHISFLRCGFHRY